MAEVKVIKVQDNPEVDVPGHTVCTGKEIAGDLIGIDKYALKIGYFGEGGTSSEHTHQESEHVFYIIDGALTIIAEGKEYTAKTGEALHIPAGIPHASANTYDGTTTYIALTLPPT
jgi:quercetin dioxygenase-like cupin family protein